MVTRQLINDFLGQRSLAVVGASRNPKKFGSIVYKTLKQCGYQVYPVNPNATTVEGDECFPDLVSLPEHVDGAVVVVPPVETERAVRDAAAAGIPLIWMQQGAESADALKFCQQLGIQVIHGECLLMYALPGQFPHNVHRFFRTLVGKMPKAQA